MQILPLILALVLLLSIMSVERLDKWINQTSVEFEYLDFMKGSERQSFNNAQKRLNLDYKLDLGQLTLRPLIEKAKDGNLQTYNQVRLVAVELFKKLYGHAAFYKELEKERPDFIDEMLEELKISGEEKDDTFLKRKEAYSQLKLSDPKLQEVYYHMLKGTVSKKEFNSIMKDPKSSQRLIEKTYPSLLTYVNADKSLKIELQHSPRELLQAVFESDEVAEAYITKRDEIDRTDTNAAADILKKEFLSKRRPGLDEAILDFKISKDNSKDYN